LPDGGVHFTDVDTDSAGNTTGAIDPLGKAGLGYGSTPRVAWRLPTIYDFNQANINGMRFVLPDPTSRLEWSSTVLAGTRSAGWLFYGHNGSITDFGRSISRATRCVGR
jgi:hypothetical protein